MNITNRNNLPEALVKAVENDDYSKGNSDFSATELLKPPRQRELQRRHKGKVEEDVEDRLYSLYGQLVHALLERANEADLVEQRFFGEFLGYTVSAQIDSLTLKDETLSDYKFTTAYKFIGNKEPDPNFIAQLNIQLELLRRNGYDAKRLQIIGLIRDFSKRKAKFDRDYPSSPIVTQEIPMWSREDTVGFIEERIRLHVAAQKKLPQCSEEDRWAKPDVYAVMKGKRAINGGIKRTLEEAQELAEETEGSFIEHRPGDNTRCENYCSVAPFCSQYKKLKEREKRRINVDSDF